MNNNDLFSKDTKPKLWLDFYPYTQHLFNVQNKEIWFNAEKFIKFVTDSQQLIKSDVLLIPIGQFYLEELKINQSKWQEWKEKRISFTAKKLLADDRIKSLLMNVMEGIQQLFNGKIPIIVNLPSPNTFLIQIKEILGFEDGTITADEIDRTTMYMADQLRTFASNEISAILFEELGELNQYVTLYKPLFNLVEHYKWSIGFKASLNNIDEHNFSSVQFLIANESSEILFRNDNFIKGMLLNSDFWLTDEPKNFEINTHFIYSIIPKGAIPEKVLEKISLLNNEN